MANWKGQQIIDLLYRNKIDSVAQLMRSMESFTKPQLNDLADLFDQKLPYTYADKFKLVLKQRGSGNHSNPPGFTRDRAYYFGFKIHNLLSMAKYSGKKMSRKEALNKLSDFIGPTPYGKMPSIKALDRDYDYFNKVQKANNHSHIIRIWPPLIKKKTTKT